jgi:hypothetical protein
LKKKGKRGEKCEKNVIIRKCGKSEDVDKRGTLARKWDNCGSP